MTTAPSRREARLIAALRIFNLAAALGAIALAVLAALPLLFAPQFADLRVAGMAPGRAFLIIGIPLMLLSAAPVLALALRRRG